MVNFLDTTGHRQCRYLHVTFVKLQLAKIELVYLHTKPHIVLLSSDTIKSNTTSCVLKFLLVACFVPRTPPGAVNI